jgi:thiamine-monophosphate kinase
MAVSEFKLIEKFFAKQISARNDVSLGIGDDCALLKVPMNQELAVSMDTLVNGVHFPEQTSAQDIGYKALAVNLSDLAAMGAEPAWVMLALTLPKADEQWLTGFMLGFNELLHKYQCQLVGGDLTRGPLSITLQVHGFIPSGQALQRNQAKPGDKIYVTGTLGAAALALQIFKGKISALTEEVTAIMPSLHHPNPRIEVGIHLRNIAHAAIDISDGLAADLGHILQQSQVGATINVTSLPLSPFLKKFLSLDQAYTLALTGGDDYELCFTVPIEKENVLLHIKNSLQTPITCIGCIEAEKGLRLIGEHGDSFKLQSKGYEHF